MASIISCPASSSCCTATVTANIPGPAGATGPAGASLTYGGTSAPNANALMAAVVGPAIYIQDDGAGALVALWTLPNGAVYGGWV